MGRSNVITSYSIHYTKLYDAGSYAGGEWPPLTTVSGTWTNDASDSPSLDKGNTTDDYSNEPQSGNRINQGAYGNTVQASKTLSCTAPTAPTSVSATSTDICSGESVDLTSYNFV